MQMDHSSEPHQQSCTPLRVQVVELVRKLVLSSLLLLFDQGSPWQIAGAALFSVLSHLLYTNCRPMKDPRAHVLQHIGLGLTTVNYFLGLMLKVEAIKDSAFAGPLLIILNLIMVGALVIAVLHRGAKMEAEVARESAAELELTDKKEHVPGRGDQAEPDAPCLETGTAGGVPLLSTMLSSNPNPVFAASARTLGANIGNHMPAPGAREAARG